MQEITATLAEELIHQGFESPELDYKRDFDDSTGAWMEIAKDVFAMANAGGGFIVFGVEDGTFKPIGLDETFHLDSQVWADKISKWATGRVELSYYEHVARVNGIQRKFPILQVHESIGSLLVPKTDGRYTLPGGQSKVAFRQGLIYTRRDTSSVVASGDEFWRLFWSLLKRTAERTGSQETPLEVLSTLTRKARPDNIEETLWFNLFPVTEIPDHVHVAQTEYRYAGEIYDAIRQRADLRGVDRNISVPSFMLHDKRIFSFMPFDEVNPLTECVSVIEEPMPTERWLHDGLMQQRLVMLLNFYLKDQCWKKGFLYDRRRDRFFRRYFDGPVPRVTWKPYKSTSTRQLVFLRFNNAGRLLYCEHFGGRLRFTILGDRIYLLIEPIRVLTSDGRNSLDWRWNVRISTKRSFLYHNNNYLYDMKLWLHILAGNRTEIHLGEDPGRTAVSILPITGRSTFGIIDDQHTSGDFLDTLKSEPLEYVITEDEMAEEGGNPLTDSSMED